MNYLIAHGISQNTTGWVTPSLAHFIYLLVRSGCLLLPISFNNKLTEWLLKNGFFSRNCFVILRNSILLSLLSKCMWIFHRRVGFVFSHLIAPSQGWISYLLNWVLVRGICLSAWYVFVVCLKIGGYIVIHRRARIAFRLGQAFALLQKSRIAA